jgi:hypothetical protein
MLAPAISSDLALRNVGIGFDDEQHAGFRGAQIQRRQLPRQLLHGSRRRPPQRITWQVSQRVDWHYRHEFACALSPNSYIV